jgi:hypothetical protein
MAFGKKRPPAEWQNTAGGEWGKALLLFLLAGGGRGGLGGLRLDHALLELVHSAGGIDKLLRARVEGMARVANAYHDDGPNRSSFDHIAAGATNFSGLIFRMYVSFHNKGRSA